MKFFSNLRGRNRSGSAEQNHQSSVEVPLPQLRPTLKASFETVSKGEGTHFTSTTRLRLMETTRTVDLVQSLEACAALLGTKQGESELTQDEVAVGLNVYHELQRVLSRNTRMGDWMSKESTFNHETPFRERYNEFLQEFDQAEQNVRKALSAPAAVRPLSLESIQEVNDFFILDNSLRETTVGVSRGHTLQEKHKIVNAMANTGLEEVILGAYGSKISVDSQIAEQWKSLGKSFDSAWGFSDAYDFESFNEDPLWEATPEYVKRRLSETDYYTPKMIPRHTYSKEDLALFRKAAKGFRDKAFGIRNRPRTVLKQAESEEGRVPLGLLMMSGYGICNAIIELDTSIETFDYQKYDIVKRCQFLTKWVKANFARRRNVPTGEDDSARVLINLRDFSNFHRSKGGTEEALRLVDALCRLPPDERPFGFMMEEPTGWLFPSEVARLCRMVRLTMARAGFPQGRFLVHVHWYFGLAEASQLAALCNGADGVWAAVCKTGAQVGHACSTMTAVNLYRAGMSSISEKYDLEKMCAAAREVTAISTREPCPPHEEIYGSQAFDIPYFMVNLPSCRYSIFHVLTKIGVKDRSVRLNELSMVTHVREAMVQYFGPPEETGWNPDHCKKMWDAIHNHLLTGLSRDYNSPLGLGHLYNLVSKKKLPWAMIQIMMDCCTITDYHPVVLDFIYRWNRLCALYEDGRVEPHPAATSKSIMFWGLPATTEPRREVLPFEFFTADVMRNPVLEPVPRLFKLQVVNMLTNDERKIQGKKIPVVNFYEMILRLKLFIEEAESLRVYGLVDDFCIRKNHDYFFGEDSLWLQEIHEDQPKVVKKVLLTHMKNYAKLYIHRGDTAITRCIESTAMRIDEKRAVPVDMQTAFRRKSAMAIIHDIADKKRGETTLHSKTPELSEAHAEMLRGLAEDDGQDEELAAGYLKENKEAFGLDEEEGKEALADAYIRERRRSIAHDELLDGGRRNSTTADMIRQGSTRLSVTLAKIAKLAEEEDTNEEDVFDQESDNNDGSDFDDKEFVSMSSFRLR